MNSRNILNVTLSILLAGCASMKTGDTSILPPAARTTVTGSNVIEITADTSVVRESLARTLAVRGFQLLPSPEPSVLQAEGGTTEDGEIVFRVTFVLTPTGATGRAWWKRGNGPTTVALKKVGIPVSDAYQQAEWGKTLSGDQAFAELARVASAVPGSSVRSSRR